jgi:stage II sporulation protein AA (anti-sigma F factor antagonist)
MAIGVRADGCTGKRSREVVLSPGVTGAQMSTHRLTDGTVVADVRGELDVASTAALRDELSAQVIAMRPPEVIVDLGLVTFMDSTALNALLGVQRNARSVGASLRVVNPSPFVAQLLVTLGVAEALGYQPVEG